MTQTSPRHSPDKKKVHDVHHERKALMSYQDAGGTDCQEFSPNPFNLALCKNCSRVADTHHDDVLDRYQELVNAEQGERSGFDFFRGGRPCPKFEAFSKTKKFCRTCRFSKPAHGLDKETFMMYTDATNIQDQRMNLEKAKRELQAEEDEARKQAEAAEKRRIEGLVAEKKRQEEENRKHLARLEAERIAAVRAEQLRIANAAEDLETEEKVRRQLEQEVQKKAEAEAKARADEDPLAMTNGFSYVSGSHHPRHPLRHLFPGAPKEENEASDSKSDSAQEEEVEQGDESDNEKRSTHRKERSRSASASRPDDAVTTATSARRSVSVHLGVVYCPNKKRNSTSHRFPILQSEKKMKNAARERRASAIAKGLIKKKRTKGRSVSVGGSTYFSEEDEDEDGATTQFSKRHSLSMSPHGCPNGASPTFNRMQQRYQEEEDWTKEANEKRRCSGFNDTLRKFASSKYDDNYAARELRKRMSLGGFSPKQSPGRSPSSPNPKEVSITADMQSQNNLSQKSPVRFDLNSGQKKMPSGGYGARPNGHTGGLTSPLTPHTPLTRETLKMNSEMIPPNDTKLAGSTAQDWSNSLHTENKYIYTSMPPPERANSDGVRGRKKNPKPLSATIAAVLAKVASSPKE